MIKRQSWIILSLVTVINIGLLIIVYFWLVQPSYSDTVGQPFPVSSTSSTFATSTPLATVDIIIAIQPISRGQMITPDIVAYRAWPEAFASRNSMYDIENMIGKIARTDIFREQPILSNMITDNLSNLAAIGSNVAAILPPGLFAKTLHIPSTKLPLGLQKGDRVDIFYTSALNASPENEFTTGLLISDVLVIWIGDNFPTDGHLFQIATPIPFATSRNPTPAPTPPPLAELASLILAVSSQDAAALIWAEEANIPLSFIMRQANTTGISSINPVNRAYLLNQNRFFVPTTTP